VNGWPLYREKEMACVICKHPEAKAINLVLLGRQGRRTGAVKELAERLHVRRETLWRHQRRHLLKEAAPTRKEFKAHRSKRSFVQRAWELGEEFRRLELQIENGGPEAITTAKMKALVARKELLRFEAQLDGAVDAGKDLNAELKKAGKRAAAEMSEEEAAEITREYLQVCVDPVREVAGEEPDGEVDAGGVARADQGEVAQ
jgi:hypothetical protein